MRPPTPFSPPQLSTYMHTKMHTTTGGHNAAPHALEPHTNTDGINGKGSPAFDEKWYNDSSDTDPHSTTYCRNWEDLARRESYDDCSDAAIPVFRTYSFDPYGKLRVVLINGEGWCSLTDAGRIAGIPVHEITGIYNEGGAHVRGAPHFLAPDGMRCLDAQGIDDEGVRLEALVPYFKKARGGSFLAEHHVSNVILDIYAKNPKKADHDGLIRWKPRRRPRSHQWQVYRFYDTCVGECRVIIIGTHAWVNAADIGKWHNLSKKVFTKIAGSSRKLKITNSDIVEVEEAEGAESYIRYDVVASVFKALGRRYCGAEELDHWIQKNLLSPKNQLDFGMFVRAKTLHGLLSKHLSFREWTSNIRFRGRYDLTDFHKNGGWDWQEGDDFRIPLTDASKIAEQTGSRRGLIVHLLLRDGGYLHNGPAAEPAHAALRRFKGLMPDRHDRVKARAVHEFIRDVSPFEVWIKKFEKGSKPGSEVEFITFDEAYEHGLREDFYDYYNPLP